ncbi:MULTISPECIES: transposase [Methylobacterium]|uniref:transposase n=1 Tax=Methylobacterium TaxID=407 RepID=UPI0013EBD223|nr:MULTISPECIES: transposase [unclassified Methylobacterium]NGM37990.1 hypothetical protein [Methylobacterium sp. DB0501]
MARVGLRLILRKQQAQAGDTVLLFGDESEALTRPYLARAWAPRGADLRVPAPGQARKIAMLGVLDHVSRALVVTTARTKRSTDFIALLERLDALYGPKPGQPSKPVVLVLDNGPIHTSKLSHAALAARCGGHRLPVADPRRIGGPDGPAPRPMPRTLLRPMPALRDWHSAQSIPDRYRPTYCTAQSNLVTLPCQIMTILIMI